MARKKSDWALTFVAKNLNPKLAPGQAAMVLAMVPDHQELRKSGAAGKVRSIVFEFRPSNPGEDDSFWLGRSPFDGKDYLFASGIGAGLPTGWVSIGRPHWWDDN